MAKRTDQRTIAQHPDTVARAAAPNPRGPGAMLRAPTYDEVLAACTTFRSDYGELSPNEQDALREEALEWLLAWRHALNAPELPPATYGADGDHLRVRLAHPRGVYRLAGAAAHQGANELSNGALGTVLEADTNARTTRVHFDALSIPVALPSDWLATAPAPLTEIVGYFDAVGQYVAKDPPIPVTRIGRTLRDDSGTVHAALDLCGEWVRPFELVAGLKLSVAVRETFPAPPPTE